MNRIALCIGVAKYHALDLALPNPVNDAQRIDAVLRTRGFDSTLLVDPDAAELTQALAALQAKIEGCASAGVFGAVFYAGHAIEIGGFGVLLPADMPYPVCPARAKHFGVPVLEIVDALKAGQGPKVVMIDACRTAVADWDVAQMQRFNEWVKEEAGRLKDAGDADDVAIAYSTAAGQPAYDGGTANSLYCEKLETALLRHDVSIVEALTQCGQQVIADTRARQRPWVYTNLSMKAGFSDLPKYALASSTTLTRKWAPGARIHARAMDDTIAINLAGGLQLLRDGEETDYFEHDESFTAAACWEDEALLAGPKIFVTFNTATRVQEKRLQTHCSEPHGIAVAPDGTFAIVYGQGGYSVLERVGDGDWCSCFASGLPSDVYGAVFQSDRVAYLCGSSDYLLRLTLGEGMPRAEKIALGDYHHVYDLACISDRQAIAAVCDGGVVIWIEPNSGNVEARTVFDWPSVDVPGAYGRLRRMELSPDESILYLADPKQFDAEHDPDVWCRTAQGRRPGYHLLCCDVTADPRVLAIGSDAGLIFLVDIRSRAHVATLDAGSDIGVPLQWMACASSGAIYAMAHDGIVRCFEPVHPRL